MSPCPHALPALMFCCISASLLARASPLVAVAAAVPAVPRVLFLLQDLICNCFTLRQVAIWFGLLAIWAIFIGFFGIILAR